MRKLPGHSTRIFYRACLAATCLAAIWIAPGCAGNSIPSSRNSSVDFAVGPESAKGEVLELLGSGNYVGAIEPAERLFAAAIADMSTTSEQRLEWITIAADALMRNAQYERAEEMLDIVDRQVTSKSEIEPELGIVYQSQQAELLILRGEHSRAASMLISILDASSRTLGPLHPTTEDVERKLAYLRSYYVQVPTGKNLLRKILRQRQDRLGPQHPKTLESLNDWGWELERQERFEEALPFFRRAAKGREDHFGSEHPFTSESNADLGFVLTQLDRTDEALELLEDALANRTETLGPAHPKTLETKADLANLWRTVGDYDRAEMLSRQVLSAYEEQFGLQSQNLTYPINSLAITLTYSGRYGEAKSLFQRNYEITESLSPFSMGRAEVLNSLGWLNRLVGNYDAAETHLLESIEIWRNSDTPTLDGFWGYSNLAEVYANTGRIAEGISIHERVLASRIENLGPNHQDSILIKLYLGRLYVQAGQIEQAGQFFREGVAQLNEVLGSTHPDTMFALIVLGDFLFDQGLVSEAHNTYQQAIMVGESRSPPQNIFLAQAYSGYSRLLEHTMSDIRITTIFAKKAVQNLQQARGEMSDFSTDMSSTFLLQYESEYLRLQELLIRQGRFAEAEQVGNMLKAKEFFEFVRRRSDADSVQSGLDQTSLEAEWEAQLASWSERPNRIAAELAVLKTKQRGGAELTALEQTQFDDLQTRYDVAYTEYKTRIDDWLASVQELSDEAIQKDANDLKVEWHDDLQLEIEQIGADVATLQLVAFEDSAHAFLITPGAFKHIELPVARTELFQAIFAARRAVQPDPQTGELDPDAKVKLRALHEILMAPIEQELADAGTETLMLNLQGAIRYVPFAALYDGEAYLTERYKLAMFTPAARTRYEAADALQEAAGFGVAMEHAPFRALPSVTRELASILGTGDEPGILTGPSYLDTAFTKAVFKSELEEERPIVHIASHFSMRPGNDSNSFLLLGDGTKLTLAEINETAAMRFRGVELLTLSACSTALSTEGSFGVDSGTGVEVEGFGVLAQRKGAKAVIASLWDVNDSSTADLMTELYANLSTGDLNKAEALQAAQKSMIRSADKNHPYYWAPFILMGNWK